ncbi:MAG: hypothetical protein HY938_10110 [Nitrosomonadales bacterium]|nr:hypothetical protein [Nitrosomonadales bacterium]
MTASKTETTAKVATTQKTPATAKMAVKPAAKQAAKKPVRATPQTAAKKTEKSPKIKKVRDSFSMPQNEYQEIAKIKDACKKAGLPVKKSAVLRAGLKALGELNMVQIKRLLAGLAQVDAGRSSKL